MSNVQSLDRALNLLELISKHSPISLNQLVSLSGLSKTTIHRLVQSLIENDYVKKDHLTHQYELSYKLFQLGYASIQNIDYLNIAKSLISKLAINVGETCHLVLEDKNEVLYIEKFIPNESQQSMSSKIGLRSPMYCTAVGKVILSTYSDDAIHQIWQATTVKAYTENTITNFDDLMDEIKVIRQKGYAEDKEENEKGIFCVGAYFVNFRNEVQGAISLSVPTSKLDKKEFFIEQLKATTHSISKNLGHIVT
ncbi:IclR family transcriptional regulator [Staphylococcus ureilyticus]|uniref:IclR family transcriptional regulator n=1 Tax=Staphylococcus ureilyticus TaxID=94138 RepID=UPI0016435B19|nr:IclR family transcriptional regulator [Staphylococcus ureilyticus]MDU0462578.1 IclR family transcriptional regulator [Staphylococcus ureilyticus]MDV3052282.1 IclR family transcriptional regulator [Staphylococcus ureilyticus]UXS59720.1 IclR family transcriptional regulator [Staphylococcus ureilyticus]